MNRLLRTAAIGTFAAMAMSTSAIALTVTTLPGAPDPGPLAGEFQVITFDNGLETGVTLTGDGQIVSNSLDGKYAAPAGDSTPNLATPISGSAGAVELKFADFLNNRDVSRFSFYWGSIDSYNTLQLLDRAGNAFYSISGAQLPFNNGDQTSSNTNRRVVFNLTGAERNLGGLLFTSTSPAFELDTISFAAVPEPATWAIMLMGFFGLGAALRTRRTTSLKAA